MLTFTIEHKYCGYTTEIKGNNVWEAFRKANKDINIWTVKSVEKEN